MTEARLPLLYRNPQVLHPQRHGNRSLAPPGDYAFSAHANAVPLVAEEMAVAARHFPIVFTDGPSPHPVAVLGLRGQHNPFVNAAGQWREGVYVPAYIRRYPFIFHENDAGTELTLCIDDAAAQLREGRDNPLFDAAGEPTPLTRHALAFCRDYQAQHAVALAFTRALVEAKLLVDHRADITLHSGQRLSLTGFKVIDEAGFAQLPDATFLQWRQRGWLPLAYAHFASVSAWSAVLEQEVAGDEAGDGAGASLQATAPAFHTLGQADPIPG